VDCDQTRITRRIEQRYLDVQADDIDDALARAAGPGCQARCRSACSATPPRSSPSCAGAPIDIVTDQTSAHDPLSYLPVGVAFDDMKEAGREGPGVLHRAGRSVDGPARRRHGRFHGQRRRGVRLRQLDPRSPKGGLHAL
jgi:urocanate hydratase